VEAVGSVLPVARLFNSEREVSIALPAKMNGDIEMKITIGIKEVYNGNDPIESRRVIQQWLDKHPRKSLDEITPANLNGSEIWLFEKEE
jgi:hypothetical protein